MTDELHTGEGRLRRNETLHALRRGEAVLGAEATMPSSWLAAVYAQAGLDFVWIDLEHTLANLQEVGVAIAHARLAGITPLVRVPDLVPHLVSQLVDNGAQGIILPFAESPDAVSEFVSCFRFHPCGRRRAANPRRAHDFVRVSMAEHIEWSEAEMLVAIQIESLAAVDSIDEIAAVEGLDLIVLGMMDMSISCGVPGQTGHPDVIDAATRTIAAAREHGLAAGVAGVTFDPAEGIDPRMWLDAGARFFQLFGDLDLFAHAVGDRVEVARQTLFGGLDTDEVSIDTAEL